MCTLLLARDVLGHGTVLLAANRDEDPARESAGPGVLHASPRIVGGRDRRANGTWLALRGGDEPLVAALLNRRPQPGAPAPQRSRGELPLIVTRAADPRAAAMAAAESGAYAPCTLLVASRRECWRLAIRHDRAPEIADIAPGWHVLTHAELDDPLEPRAHFLLERLRRWHPPSKHEAMARAGALLATHAHETHPAVCLHEGPMRTVSSSRVWIDEADVAYAHLEGRPCEHAFADHSALLREPLVTSESRS